MVRLLQKAGRWFPMPQYRCRMCRRTFTRLTGTPLARTRWPAKQAAFIPYLGMPLQINQVAEALAVDFGTIDDWLRRYRALADASDATGQLASRIRLGATLAPDELCAGCGSNARVTAPDANHVQCKTCGRFLARLPVALVR